MTLLRSAVFFLWFALVSTVLGLAFLPGLILPRKVIVWMSRRWSALNFWGLRVFAGVRFEVRGTVPRDGVLVAAKHMSMWDTMALYLVLDDPAVVLKRGLQFIPFYGWYITKAGSIAIDHAKVVHTSIAAPDDGGRETRAGRRTLDPDFPGRHTQEARCRAGL